jgi:hypothetical protein
VADEDSRAKIFFLPSVKSFAFLLKKDASQIANEKREINIW